MTRFFRTNTTVYEGVRSSLDALWVHPKTVGIVHTESCLHAVEDAVTDDEGNVYVPLHDSFFQWQSVQDAISNLIINGQVVEITSQEYESKLPPSPILIS